MKQEYANTVDNNHFTSSHREVNFYSDISINGTLSIPNNNEELKPAVVLIPGSGSVDRDGNVKLLKSDLLLKLSELFTQNGFVTLRYDKRGVGKSASCYVKAGLTEFIDDAVSAVRFLKNSEGMPSGPGDLLFLSLFKTKISSSIENSPVEMGAVFS